MPLTYHILDIRVVGDFDVRHQLPVLKERNSAFVQGGIIKIKLVDVVLVFGETLTPPQLVLLDTGVRNTNRWQTWDVPHVDGTTCINQAA